ncbi:MAG: efflux RND transporter permease subunit [Planctomycetota bacterium]
MDPIRFAIHNRVKVAVGVILLVLFGLLALRSLPVQLTPDVDPTIITVTTEWTGASPEEIEREIVEEQEDVLKNVRNLVKMVATASQGEASIELEFTTGTPLESARVEVSDALREVPEYPDDAEEPVIVTGESGPGSPIAWLLLTTQTDDFDVQTLGDAAEDRIKPFLERAAGVSEVRVYGGREREVHIDFDPFAVAQRRITVDQLAAALRRENANVSAGELDEGRYQTRIRTVGQYDDLNQIRQTVVAYDDTGGPIRIDDLAEVSVGFEKRRSFVRSRGTLALAMPVYKESGANVIAVMEQVQQRIDEVNAQELPAIAVEIQRTRGLAAPPELFLRQVYDETGYIYDALGLVQANLVVGGVLAVIALLAFLELRRRPWLVAVGVPVLLVLMIAVRVTPPGFPTYVTAALLAIAVLGVLWIARPTLVIAVAIPISVIGTFVVMIAFGRNLNVISLAGLAFAVGMVVDNAIVVLENIDRHTNMGKPPARAAYDGAREVWGAVLASTLTTLAVFVPVLTIQEEAGQLFRDIALAICAAVSLSLIVSITVIPSLSARILRRRSVSQTQSAASPEDAPTGLRLNALARVVRRVIDPGAAGVSARVAVVALFTMAAVGGAWFLMPPTDYLPRGNQNLVFGILLTPPGYAVEQAEDIGLRVEEKIRPYWEAESSDELQGLPPVIDFFTGEQVDDVPPLDNYFFVGFNGLVFNGATSVDKNNVKPIEALLGSATTGPWGFGFAAQSSLFGRGSSGSRQIDIELSGSDLAEVRDAGAAVLGAMRGLYGFAGVQPTPTNFDKQAREVRLELDRVKATELGLDMTSLGGAVAAMVDGVRVGDFRLSGEAIDILARQRIPEGDRPQPERLAQVPLAFRNGAGETGVVPLSAVANIRRTVAPQEIRRIEERRAVTLAVTPPDEVPLETATADIENVIAGMRASGAIAPTVEIDLAGSASKLEEVREQMVGAWSGFNAASVASVGASRLLLALLVTYLLMAALFESFVYPFVILFSVPLAAVGGFVGLKFVHDGWGMADWPIVGESLYAALGPGGWGLIQPTQLLDTLTMLGFVILIGVVVNNAILLVHQSLNFMRGLGDSGDTYGVNVPMPDAIAMAVQTRVRPIFMTTATSVAGMLPLVLTPGSGSELYRGLGAVVVGGLVVSTVFTLVLVPLLLSLMMQVRPDQAAIPDTQAATDAGGASGAGPLPA